MAAGRASNGAAAESAQAFDSAVLALVTVLRRKPARGAREPTLERAATALHSLRTAAEADRGRVAAAPGSGAPPATAAVPSNAALQQLLGCLRTTDTGAVEAVFEATCVLVEGERCVCTPAVRGDQAWHMPLTASDHSRAVTAIQKADMLAACEPSGRSAGRFPCKQHALRLAAGAAGATT
jgi:hypothetical protein